MDPRPPPLNLQVPLRQERSHAARNRRAVLAAAERLFAERCPSEVTMEEVAAAAGVGKGTVYRRFGDRAGLAFAVLDARTRVLQDEVLRGPPPIGPGAPPAARLRAFLDRLVDLLETSLELAVVAETAVPGARYRSEVYAGWRMHVGVLLREVRGGEPPMGLPDVLLAPLAAELYRHMRSDRGLAPEDVKAALGTLVQAVCDDRSEASLPGG